MQRVVGRAAVREPGESVDERACRSTMPCRRAFSRATTACAASDAGIHPLLLAERVADELEGAEAFAGSGQRKDQPFAVATGIAGP